MNIQPQSDRNQSFASIVRTVPPFVGRKEYLDWLEDCLQEAIAGRPRLILIEGEAGIGKTRLLKEMRVVALRHAVQVCSGRSYEDLSLPYLPFMEALRSPMEQIFVEVESTLGPDAKIIRQFFSYTEGASFPAHSVRADQEKLRLFLALSQAMIVLARHCPTLFVLDDLHWADQSILDLFGHVVFTVADTAAREPVPLLIVGIYRPVEMEERLARLITRFQREEICQTLVLPGLNELEVYELLQGLGLRRPSHQLVATISQATQGNPLFIQEVLHHLVKRDALQEQGGYVITSSSSADLPLPKQVTGAIITRFQDLSERCRTVLTLASFLGENFSLQKLAVLSGVNEDELLDLLEEGLHHRFLLSEGQTFRFTHSLFRHVCYNEPSVARRQRIHHQIARTLEDLYAGHLEDHILEIAYHLVKAGPVVEREKIIQYARQAGDQAFKISAWGDAAYYYTAALSVAESGNFLSPHDLATLHYQAGVACYRDMDVGPCLAHYQKAIEAYRQTDDVRGLAQALMEKTRVQFTLASVPYGTLVDVQPLEEVLQALDQKEVGLRGRISTILALAYWTAKQPDKAQKMAYRALEIGQNLPDDRLCSHASFALGMAELQMLCLSETLESWQQSLNYARRANDPWFQDWPLTRMPLHLIRLGRLDEGEAVALEGSILTRQAHDWANHSMALAALVTAAVIRGDFVAAEKYAHETLMMVSRSRYPWGGTFALPALACARALRGAWAEAEDALDILMEPGRIFEEPGPVFQTDTWIYRQFIHAYTGDFAAVEVGSASELFSSRAIDPYILAPLCALVEIGDLMDKPSLDGYPYQILSMALERGALFSAGGWTFLIPRILGVAATLNQRWDKAEAHFQRAIDVATSIGARPELGQTYLNYARMFLARKRKGDRHRASELVKQAVTLFLELGMKPFIRRGAQLAETLEIRIPEASRQHPVYPGHLSDREVTILLHIAQGHAEQEIADSLMLSLKTLHRYVKSLFSKIGVTSWTEAAAYAVEKRLVLQTSSRAQTSRPAEPTRAANEGEEHQKPAEPDQPLRVILVTDMEGSTDLIQRFGDTQAQEFLRMHNTIIRTCLREYHGTEVIHTGDGIEASFSSASNAIECAMAIQQAFTRHNQEYSHAPIRVRIGINAGEPISTEGRLFGTAVHTTFRICDCARPGQILVSDVVYHLAAGKDFLFVDRGPFALKGFREEIRLYELAWESA